MSDSEIGEKRNDFVLEFNFDLLTVEKKFPPPGQGGKKMRKISKPFQVNNIIKR